MLEYIYKITEPLLLQSYVILFLISFAVSIIIIISSRYGFTGRAALDVSAVQSAHSGFVPRVGGLAIYFSILGLVPLLTYGFIPLSVVFDLNVEKLVWLIFSAIPVFLVGTTEDLGYPMAPKRRLFASAVSSLIAVVCFKVWISRLGIPFLDEFLILAPMGMVFTIFATVGVVNAFNLIDGLNGLSSYVTVSTSLALSYISFQVGNMHIAIFLIMLTAAVLGFMILNFPFGKIFLGDGGAYVLGHLLVWSAIIMINYEQSISAFAILLIFFWPVADTGLAIWRRWKIGTPADRPDRLHFHQLAMRFLEIRFFGREKRNITNPLATVFLVPFISVPQLLGVMLWKDFSATVWATFFVGLLFITTYVFGVKLAKRSRLVN